jgi:hypothetical protein
MTELLAGKCIHTENPHFLSLEQGAEEDIWTEVG